MTHSEVRTIKGSNELEEEKKPAPSIEEVIEDVRLERGDTTHGDDTSEPPPVLSLDEQRRMWRKIDMRFMPIFTLMYLCSYVDRGNIGNAKLQGLTAQLNLTGQKYNIALTVFFVSYYVFAVPANLVLKKLRPSRWLPSITIAWGFITTLMGLVKTYPQLVGVRLCLGMAECGLACGVFYHLTLWYPRHMLQTRISIFFGGATFAGAFSGLLAFAISFMSGTAGLLGWSWIFILEGILTMVVGAVALFILVDFPRTAKFLTDRERAYLIYTKKYDNSSVGEEEHFEVRHIREAILDWQIWALGIINVVDTVITYGITLFLPSIINGFGFDATISQLLTVPPYAVATILVILSGIWSDHVRKRSPFVFASFSLAFVGFAINLADVSIGPKYFGTFLAVTGGYTALPTIATWLPNNLVGHYKRGVGLAILVTFSDIGGIIASNIYRAQDAPRYILGHAIEVSLVGMGLVLVPLTAFTYARINMQREEALREAEEKGCGRLAEDALRRLGDRAPDFRYTL